MSIIDTAARTTKHLGCLRDNGVRSVIRYYARRTGLPEKRLTRAEAEALVTEQLSIGVACQSSGRKAAYFSYESGLADGSHACDYGFSVVGQPAGSAIYFAVDYDAGPDDLDTAIIPYFEGIAEAFKRSEIQPGYDVGVYGSGIVCRRLLELGLARYTWLSQSKGHNGHQEFKASGEWTLLQHLPSDLCGLKVDPDELNPSAASFGEFSTLAQPGTKVAAEVDLVASAPIPGPDPGAHFVDWFNSQGFKHFKPYELLIMGAKNGNPESPCFQTNTHPPEELWHNIVPTLRVLDILRERLNAPIRITSAYRSPEYNHCIGGARESMHMDFKAIDFFAEGNSRPYDWARTLRSMRDDERIFDGGVGLYPGFVHVDTGPTRDW